MKQKEKEKKQQGESNILVAIRIRPLNQKEVSIGDWDIVRTQDNLIIILDPVQKQFEMENKKMLDVLHRSKEQRYAFDKIYRNQSSQKIYDQTTRTLIKTVVTGKNATVFAYGPTGTGKTHTMLGNQDVYGLNVLAIRDIFSLIEQDSQYDYTINITYVQIYNEMIRDLLVPTSNYLQLRDDNEKGTTIAGVTQFRAQSTEQVMNLLLIGNKRRTTEATNANQTSSRSHAVFQINVIKTPRTKNTSVETLSGKLSLIDLAGSQRGTVTENRGIRLMEGAKINRSLLALANCINALGDKNKKGFFVPYRDSKLTRLLKDSLGGNCKTVMIVNISPASSQFEQTINTLKYANRAKNIKTKALTNKKLVSIHISEYKNIINDLRQEIDQLKIKLQNKNVPQGDIEQNYNNGSNVNVNVNANFNVNGGSTGGYGVNQSVVCNCGRIEESNQIRKVKQQIFQNFNQRIQLRRALMEIQQQNALNMLQIKKKKNQIALLKKSDPDNPQPPSITHLQKTIQTLKLNTHKNILKKQIINLQLVQSMTSTKKIRNEIPKKVKSKQNRQFLQIIIKNHILQLQNIQLEINLQIQEKIIGDLKNIADRQKRVIEETGICVVEDGEGNGGDGGEIQLEIEEDEDNQQEQEQDNNGDDIENNGIAEQDYQDDFEQQLQNQLISKDKNKKKKSENITKQFQQIQQGNKNKLKPMQQQNQNSNNLQLGIFGINNIKKREKTITDNRQPLINPNSIKNANTNPTTLSASKDNTNTNNNNNSSSVDNLLDFNLKGVNLKLNQKLPFAVVPKEKKKK